MYGSTVLGDARTRAYDADVFYADLALHSYLASLGLAPRVERVFVHPSHPAGVSYTLISGGGVRLSDALRFRDVCGPRKGAIAAHAVQLALDLALASVVAPLAPENVVIANGRMLATELDASLASLLLLRPRPAVAFGSIPRDLEADDMHRVALAVKGMVSSLARGCDKALGEAMARRAAALLGNPRPPSWKREGEESLPLRASPFWALRPERDDPDDVELWKRAFAPASAKKAIPCVGGKEAVCASTGPSLYLPLELQTYARAPRGAAECEAALFDLSDLGRMPEMPSPEKLLETMNADAKAKAGAKEANANEAAASEAAASEAAAGGNQSVAMDEVDDAQVVGNIHDLDSQNLWDTHRRVKEIRADEGDSDQDVADYDIPGADEKSDPGVDEDADLSEAAEAAGEAGEAGAGEGEMANEYHELRVRSFDLDKEVLEDEQDEPVVRRDVVDFSRAITPEFIPRQRAIAEAAQPYVASFNGIEEARVRALRKGWIAQLGQRRRDAPPHPLRAEGSVIPALYYRGVGIPHATMRPWEILVPAEEGLAKEWESYLRGVVVNGDVDPAGDKLIMGAEDLAEESRRLSIGADSRLGWADGSEDLSAPTARA